MKRGIFAVVAGVSLLTCVWGCVVWVRSYQSDASPMPSTAPMQARLSQLLPGVAFYAPGIVDVVNALREMSDNQIDANWAALKAAGIDPDTPVPATLRHLRFGQALSQELAAADLRYFVDNELLIVAPRGQAVWTRATERRPPTPGSVNNAMRRQLSTIRWDWIQLSRLLEVIDQKAAVPISCNWEKLKSAGIEPRTPIRGLYLQHASAAQALSVVLANLDAKEDLQFRVGASQVLVSTRADFDREPRPAAASSWSFIVFAVSAAIVALAAVVSLWKRTLRRSNHILHIDRIGPALVLVSAAIVAVATWKHGPPFWESVFKSSRWTVTAHRGTLRVWHTPADPAAPYQDVTHVGKATAPDEEKVFDRAGFFIRWAGSPFNSWVAGIPLWGLVPLAALSPLLRLAAHIHRRRKFNQGLCPTCGYNLTRNTSGVCPECGTPVPQKAEATA